jgi:hypothetical protein
MVASPASQTADLAHVDCAEQARVITPGGTFWSCVARTARRRSCALGWFLALAGRAAAASILVSPCNPARVFGQLQRASDDGRPRLKSPHVHWCVFMRTWRRMDPFRRQPRSSLLQQLPETSGLAGAAVYPPDRCDGRATRGSAARSFELTVRLAGLGGMRGGLSSRCRRGCRVIRRSLRTRRWSFSSSESHRLG